VTVSEGTNTLMGFDYEKTAVEAETVFQGNYKKGKIPELWDGKTAERIAEIIYENISKN
jgi:UDP-N-acetylglucosamine 2-epimerase (non-hydrolysing)